MTLSRSLDRGRFCRLCICAFACYAAAGPLSTRFVATVRAQESAEPEQDRADRDDDVREDQREIEFNTDRLFVPRWRLTDGPHVRAAFRTVVARTTPATVRVYTDGKRHSLGGVVGADGWILTKATPLFDKVTVRFPDGSELAGTTVGSNRQYDLALIKVDATGLQALDLGDSSVPQVGAWLASVGPERDPVAVGVVSVGPREIPAQPGRLGIMMDERNEPIANEVVENGAAAVAGVKPNDRIVSVEGQATTTGAELRKVISSFNPGDIVALEIERGGERLTLRATLQETIPGFGGRSEFQNNLGGRLSARRFGFPMALQHDTVLRPVDCGGPVVDIDGKVVGFNIARAGRTESLLIPTASVREVVRELMAAGLAAVAEPADASAAEPADADETEIDDDAEGEADVANGAVAADDSIDDKSIDDKSIDDDSLDDDSIDDDSIDDDSIDGKKAYEGGEASAPPIVVETVPASKAIDAYKKDGYKLVWFDEFEGDGRPDADKWTYERGFVRNEELQWYRPDNARCKDGLLVIEARKERVPNPRYKADSERWQESREFAEYTSASLLTRGRAEWKYGRFEMRGRIDARSGLWPAWWTLGNGGWPACGEIDIMEYYRGMVLANFAWAGDNRWRPKWDDSRTRLKELGGDDWPKEFHVWRMDWDEDSIALSVDGRVLNEIDATTTINAGTEKVNPFQAPHYMILNLAIGGMNGGSVGDTKFPATFEVDYVRVYQK